VQLLMKFLDTTPSSESAPVWSTLEQARRNEVVATLARLIVKVADPSVRPDVDKEARDE
jgi:uncharacterized circularly permuted ATP-grasp superfamily protein